MYWANLDLQKGSRVLVGLRRVAKLFLPVLRIDKTNFEGQSSKLWFQGDHPPSNMISMISKIALIRVFC